MDTNNKYWLLVLCLILTMVITSTAQAEPCSDAAMRDPTSLTHLVVINKLDDDTDISRYMNFYNCRSLTIGLVNGLIDNVARDIAGSWHYRQRIIDRLKNDHIPNLRQTLQSYTSRNSGTWPSDYKSINTTQKQIEKIFLYHANFLYDNYCPCIISSDGSKSCAPPDMPDQIP